MAEHLVVQQKLKQPLLLEEEEEEEDEEIEYPVYCIRWYILAIFGSV